MPSFQYGTTTIEYTLEYVPNKNHVTISVEWLDGVKVVVPENMESDQLNSILYKKAPWILEKWYKFNEIADPPAPKEFVSGEKFPYLGRNYRLKVHKREDIELASLTFQQGRFIANVPSYLTESDRKRELYQLFKDWYISHGKLKVDERLKIYSSRMSVAPSKVVLKEQKMRWGTCTSSGAIYLNWRIVMAPIPVIDYLLVHELAHLKYPNHSNDFWRFVHSILPDYEQRKEWLRINGPLLTLE
ncbi:M48 family peptidase [Geobacillus stearothermophilus]|uniref:M48 family metallopeptidase n=1 Tax=Geobacillus sp. YHL TaxID=2796117 RepID=UPI000B92B671|nr:SprT family zinc-dependent metalloprotease [Geobacillus sp. YHL]ASS88162.1 zinc metalloprotease [Geobacillus lituanicus]MCG6794479.1 M48 family metallopeptidase [Geobacillus sp. YHL]QHN48634.1 M48 family peptidase [Geobacillus stearothermophilus]